jgi:hypothetical protein
MKIPYTLNIARSTKIVHIKPEKNKKSKKKNGRFWQALNMPPGGRSQC